MGDKHTISNNCLIQDTVYKSATHWRFHCLLLLENGDGNSARWKIWLIWLVGLVLSRWAFLCQTKLQIGAEIALCHSQHNIQPQTMLLFHVCFILYTHVCVFQGAVPDGDGEIVALRGVHVRSLQCISERAGFCGGAGLCLLPALLWGVLRPVLRTLPAQNPGGPWPCVSQTWNILYL